jgi:hypothetical protein
MHISVAESGILNVAPHRLLLHFVIMLLDFGVTVGLSSHHPVA